MNPQDQSKGIRRAPLKAQDDASGSENVRQPGPSKEKLEVSENQALPRGSLKAQALEALAQADAELAKLPPISPPTQR